MSKAFNNWKVVLLCLIGATTFWFFNALNKDYDARISYPIDFVFDRDSVVIMKSLPATVDIDVSSGGWNLLRKTFWFNVTPIKIALENPTEIGFYTRSSLLPIVSDQLSDLKINYLVTDTLYINIERKKTKRVKLRIDSLGIDLADNYRIVSSIKISPDSSLLTGPISFIDTMTNSWDLRLPTRGISSEYNREVTVVLPGGRLTSSSPEQVTVRFEVERFERHSMEIPLEMENFPEDSSSYLTTNKVQVFYTIAESKQEKFSPNDFLITTDLTMMDKSDSTVMAILVYYPEVLEDVEVIPENIPVIRAKK